MAMPGELTELSDFPWKPYTLSFFPFSGFQKLFFAEISVVLSILKVWNAKRRKENNIRSITSAEL